MGGGWVDCRCACGVQVQWFFLDEAGTQQGPVGASDVRAMRLPPTTLLWNPALPEWKQLSDLPEL